MAKVGIRWNLISVVSYGVGGFIMGLCLAICGTIATLMQGGNPATLDTLIALHQTSPSLWILDSLPLVLTALGISFSTVLQNQQASAKSALDTTIASANEHSDALYARSQQLTTEGMRYKAQARDALHQRDAAIREVRFARALLNTVISHASQTDKAPARAKDEPGSELLLQVLQDAQDIYSLRNERLVLQDEPVHVRNLLTFLIREMNLSRPADPILFQVDIGPNCPKVIQADRARLSHIFQAGIRYAASQSQSNRLTLSATTGSSSDEVTFSVQYAVQPGNVPLEPHPTLQFDTNDTGDEVIKGLGLSVAEGLAAAMGGQLGIGRRSESIAAVWWTLPVGSEEVSLVNTSPFQHSRILVASDCDFTRAGIGRTLRNRGADVHESTEDETTLERLREAGNTGMFFDLVILSMKTENTDLPARIQVLPEAMDTPILVLACPIHSRLRSTQPEAIEAMPVPTFNQVQLIDQVSLALESRFETHLQPSSALGTQRPQFSGGELGGMRNSYSTPSPASRLQSSATGWTGEVSAQTEGRILLVDDDKVSRSVIAKMLMRLGFEVIACSNGRAALDQLEKRPFDALTIDCMMPGMSGFATAAAVRIMENDGEHLPIIGMTAGELSRITPRALDSGMDVCLSKPLRLEDIQIELQRHLDTTPQHPTEAQLPTEEIAVIEPRVIANLRLLLDTPSEDTVTGIIDLYLESVSAHLLALSRAVRIEDRREVVDLAQRLLSSSAQIGATRVAKRCSQLIESSEHAHPDMLETLLEGLTLDVERTNIALQEHRESPQST